MSSKKSGNRVEIAVMLVLVVTLLILLAVSGVLGDIFNVFQAIVSALLGATN